MKSACFQTVVLGALLALGNGSIATPIQKVIELMNGMVEKGKQEKHDEQVQFAAYKKFCEDTTTQKAAAIEKANQHIEKCKADIEKFATSAESLAKKIAELDEDISLCQGDQKAATKVRSIEKSDYEATHKDLSESVDALERAIAVLKKEAYNRPQAKAFLLQLTTSASIPKSAKAAINAFLGEPEDPMSVSAPEAHGYEFRSSGIIDMLMKLEDKFIAQRTTLEKEETDSVHAYNMMMQELTMQEAEDSKDRDEKAKFKATALQNKADTEGELSDTVTTRDDDVTFTRDLTATCETKAGDFEKRQTLRAEEIEAVQKAIEIISGNSVSGSGEKHLPQFLQQSSSLAQLRSEINGQLQTRAANYLHGQAQRLNSRVLETLSTRVMDDPFKKVKKMIKELIVRLMEEANEEAEHKGWCDTELATNQQSRRDKTALVETLNAEIDQLETSLVKLKEDMGALTTAIADLDAAMAEATKLRSEEKAKNAETISDAAEAQTAVAQAMTVLREFYAKAAEATAMVQAQPVAPEIFDAPYKGMQAENGGVIGMLDVIMSDFARLQADTEGAEVASQKEYDEFMTDSKTDKASKSMSLEHKQSKSTDQAHTLQTKKSDLEGTQKELDAILDYYEKLKPSCVDSGVSYEDRVGRRKEEIESLQEALRILNGEDIS